VQNSAGICYLLRRIDWFRGKRVEGWIPQRSDSNDNSTPRRYDL